ncbi:hypothetical protein CH370_09630 [Leptospira kmetyi]|uniref:hypothetical protein n=1 Tax=Leptospira kmetyi TaxID=408139 RepID=UPI000C2AF3EB|nr:hypothetical protein [Leptospira kmetyi]PJZ41691.1 hypothetical protein CH370_09630 [Leptospira kmetyi]
MSIRDWRSLNYSELKKQVEAIKEINPFWSDQFLSSSKPIEEDSPGVSKALDSIIQSGKISENAIFRLSSSQKLLIVYKYGEGFGNVYNLQTTELKEKKELIKKLTDTDPDLNALEIKALREQLKSIRDNWVRTPINSIIEKKGFQKLFSKMYGVYVIPVNQLPAAYAANPRRFIDEVILPESEDFLLELKKDKKYKKIIGQNPKYIIISQIISLSDLKIQTSERSLNFSSPILTKMLLSNYLSRSISGTKDIIINDLIRNVDFLSLISSDSNTGRYFHQNFERLKLILFDDYSIDLYRPIGLLILTNEQIELVVDKFIGKSKKVRKQDVRKILKAKIDTYKQIEVDLEKLKLK